MTRKIPAAGYAANEKNFSPKIEVDEIY